jgi:ABC-type transport system involved in cytochrome bd biosynthesis fused ATPase/permease subunit
MIAHRDESLSSCDYILRLQHGGIVADTPAVAI